MDRLLEPRMAARLRCSRSAILSRNMPGRESATAIIVGAGVTGLSAAYHLAKKRFGRIIVIEKGPSGDGSSGRAAGIITGLLWTETGVLVRKRCLELYAELSQDLPGYRFQQVGCLNLFSRETWPKRLRLLPLYDRLHVPYEIPEQAAIVRRWRAADGSGCPRAPAGNRL